MLAQHMEQMGQKAAKSSASAQQHHHLAV